MHIEQKSLTVAEFREIASAPENQPPARFNTGNAEDIERAFWKHVTHSAPLYGADGIGSLFDESVKVSAEGDGMRVRAQDAAWAPGL